MVEEIHLEGGTILGTSRAEPNVTEIVKRLGEDWAVPGVSGARRALPTPQHATPPPAMLPNTCFVAAHLGGTAVACSRQTGRTQTRLTHPAGSVWRPGCFDWGCSWHRALRLASPGCPRSCHRPCADLWKIDMLFVVGGRGGNAAAELIHRECRAQKVSRQLLGRAGRQPSKGVARRQRYASSTPAPVLGRAARQLCLARSRFLHAAGALLRGGRAQVH